MIIIDHTRITHVTHCVFPPRDEETFDYVERRTTYKMSNKVPKLDFKTRFQIMEPGKAVRGTGYTKIVR